MGTVASLHVHDDVSSDVVDAVSANVWDELDRLERLFSTFRLESEVSRINDGSLHLLDASAEVLEVLDLCTWLEQISDGAFCARRPADHAIDPAGFVKGWAAQKASHALDRAGLNNWYLSVGGDLQTRGQSSDGPWRVAIADPTSSDPEALRAVIDVVDEAVATSGTSQRGAHLWDGRSRQAPAHDIVSMTVVGPNLVWADAFATTAFVLGRAGIDWVAQFAGYRALAITADGGLVHLAGSFARPAA